MKFRAAKKPCSLEKAQSSLKGKFCKTRYNVLLTLGPLAYFINVRYRWRIHRRGRGGGGGGHELKYKLYSEGQYVLKLSFMQTYEEVV